MEIVISESLAPTRAGLAFPVFDDRVKGIEIDLER